MVEPVIYIIKAFSPTQPLPAEASLVATNVLRISPRATEYDMMIFNDPYKNVGI